MIVQCFKYINPHIDTKKGILITALLSDEEKNPSRELNVDGTILVLKSFGKATSIVDEHSATFILYPVDIHNPTQDMIETVIAPLSPQAYSALST